MKCGGGITASKTMKEWKWQTLLFTELLADTVDRKNAKMLSHSNFPITLILWLMERMLENSLNSITTTSVSTVRTNIEQVSFCSWAWSIGIAENCLSDFGTTQCAWKSASICSGSVFVSLMWTGTQRAYSCGQRQKPRYNCELPKFRRKGRNCFPSVLWRKSKSWAVNEEKCRRTGK